MDDQATRDLLRRVGELERTTVRYRRGEVSAISPLDITLGAAAPVIEDAPQVTSPSAAGDPVDVLTYGGGLLVLGEALDTNWHEIGASSEPAFQNSWANVGGSYATVAFRHAGNGLVALKGSCKDGTLGTTIFTLPAAYRPAQERRISWVAYDAGVYYPGILLVTADGLVQAYATGPSGTVDQAGLEVVFAL